MVLVPALGTVASIFRNASERRLFSSGDTTRPPSVRSAVFSMFSEHRGLIGTVILARVDRTDRNASLTQSSPKLLGKHLALIIEVSLGRDVVEIERISVGLIREGSAVADNDHETAGT